ncbi:hypothetical protein CBW65_12570 [Tumebacillus avium]|uniref:Phosphoglycerate mutase n=1 Tax=Tumebacillus avium TaxID=1903704 RepID=A0A1Y0IPM2_9BACL|nr:hypothetical protein [Tumebacillus avium]ARU61766.1 hypothetical protein CBW65_12570 [Tumebacillus avium]
MMKKVFAEPDFAFPEGESNNHVLAALHDLLHNHPGRKIAVGFHGNIMTILMGNFDVRYDLAFGHTLEKPDIYKLAFEGDQYLGTERIWKQRVL